MHSAILAKLKYFMVTSADVLAVERIFPGDHPKTEEILDLIPLVIQFSEIKPSLDGLACSIRNCNASQCESRENVQAMLCRLQEIP